MQQVEDLRLDFQIRVCPIAEAVARALVLLVKQVLHQWRIFTRDAQLFPDMLCASSARPPCYLVESECGWVSLGNPICGTSMSSLR